jgi:hypothetical protein
MQNGCVLGGLGAGVAVLLSPSPTHHPTHAQGHPCLCRVGDHPLVRVSLFPPLEGALQPGSTIAGALEFTHLSAPDLGHPPAAARTSGAGDGTPPAAPAAAPRCMQVLVLLETEESVQEEQRGSSKGSGVIRRVWDEQLEVTADVACSNFLFTLPPDSPATFSTPLVQLK